jgi:hypothetical protein
VSPADLAAAAVRWDNLAAEKAAWGNYEASRGDRAPAAYNLATACKRAAEALRLHASTGEEHCVCCLKPMSIHAGRRS